MHEHAGDSGRGELSRVLPTQAAARRPPPNVANLSAGSATGKRQLHKVALSHLHSVARARDRWSERQQGALDKHRAADLTREKQQHNDRQPFHSIAAWLYLDLRLQEPVRTKFSHQLNGTCGPGHQHNIGHQVQALLMRSLRDPGEHKGRIVSAMSGAILEMSPPL